MSRATPYSARAEQGVLGVLLMANATAESVLPMLTAEDFYSAQHAAIYTTIQALLAAGRPADVLTVHDRGGHEIEYLNDLATQGLASDRQAIAYAQIIREKAVRRELMRIGASLVDDAQHGSEDGADVMAIAERAGAALLALQVAGQRFEPRLLSSLLPDWLDALDAKSRGEVETITTGLEDLDILMGGGFRRQELTVLGARPSMGKSALTLHISRAAGQRHRVLILSQEDSEEMLITREVAAAGAVNLADIRAPQRAPDSMWNGVSEGVETLQALQVCIDTQPALTKRDVRRKMQQARKRMGGLDVVIVDYLQMMAGEGENRNQVLGDILVAMKGYAKDFDCAVLMLSQLSRKADETDGPPRIDHLRDSGEIEAVADNIALLWRQARRTPTEENKHWAQLELAKHKHGATDTVHLHFDGATQRFSAWAGPVPWKKGRA